MKIVTILGARPNFIKAFLISQELKKRGHKEIIIHTGQHYDFQMSEVFFQELHIPTPAYNLNLRSEQINEMIRQIGDIIKEKKPDVVLTYGDTNSSMAGAMAGWFHDIKVAHVEAGERCFDMEMPEERNRIIIDHYAEWLFAPTKRGERYAKNEGKKKVWFTGNVMYDAIHFYKKTIDKKETYKKYTLRKKEFVLMTLHRQHNVDSKENLHVIFACLKKIKKPVLLPIHPRTKQRLADFGLADDFAKIVTMVEPVNYLDMLSLIKDAAYIVTDSGGVQTDAFCLKTPCITLLEKSGWQETIDLGWNKLAGIDEKKFTEAIASFTKNPPTKTKNIFGDGKAYLKILDQLEHDNP